MQYTASRPFYSVILAVLSALCAAGSSTSAAGFPGGVTPSDVFAAMDQVNRTLDHILEAKDRRSAPTPQSYEIKLQPSHVYQMAVACANRTAELSGSLERTQVKPGKYFPKDVREQAEIMLGHLRIYAKFSKITGLPEDRGEFTGKKPSDVFALALQVFIKTSTLVGKAKISPNEAFAQMTVCVGDAHTILQSSNTPASTNSPKPQAGRKPADVFQQALVARTKLNGVRQRLGLAQTPTPKFNPDTKIKPIDVYIQAQVLLAELNQIKLAMALENPAPEPYLTAGNTPTDVWAQAALLGHLADQIAAEKAQAPESP